MSAAPYETIVPRMVDDTERLQRRGTPGRRAARVRADPELDRCGSAREPVDLTISGNRRRAHSVSDARRAIASAYSDDVRTSHHSSLQHHRRRASTNIAGLHTHGTAKHQPDDPQ